jgi:mutator protein MutT
MISEHRFEGFNPKFIVVGCHLECNGKILLLRRQKNKDNGGKWSTPAGKVDSGETEGEAIVREVFEETGIELDSGRLSFIERSYVRFPTFDFLYVFFKYVLESDMPPKISLSQSEHTEYRWMTPKEALDLGDELMQDEDYCIKRTYRL